MEIALTKTSGFSRCNSEQALDAAASADLAPAFVAVAPVQRIDETGSSEAAKNMHAVLTFAVINQITNTKASVSDADMAIRSALSMLGISDAKAKKLTEAKLPL